MSGTAETKESPVCTTGLCFSPRPGRTGLPTLRSAWSYSTSILRLVLNLYVHRYMHKGLYVVRLYGFTSIFICIFGIWGKKKGTNHLRLSGIPLTVATSRSWRGWVAPAAQNLSLIRREGDSNPRRLLTLHDFQSCTFDHSDISPNDKMNITKRALLFKFFRSDRDSNPR